MVVACAWEGAKFAASMTSPRSTRWTRLAGTAVAVAIALTLQFAFTPVHASAAAPAQEQVGEIPGDPENNATKWLLLGVGGLALIAIGVGALVWKRKLETDPPADSNPKDPFAAPSEPPVAEDGQVLPKGRRR